MLRGIDISNHQAGFTIPGNIDFCIVKATEGTNFVDPYCDDFIQDCLKKNILFGYYHFAHDEPVKEARYFWNNTLGYSGHGIPIIDYERTSTNAKSYLEIFCQEYHKLSAVWPIVYISALSTQGNVHDLTGSWIPEKCGLWLAGYPKFYNSWINDDCPYDIGPWKFCAIWQFTDSFKCNGYEIDADLAYMDKEGWKKYAACKKTASTAKGKSCEQIADEVLAGKWGTGWNRKQALTSVYGVGTYEHVQAIINERMI